ncbi:hypothetical protein L9F63_011789, partial [Diploptera punctata]
VLEKVLNKLKIENAVWCAGQNGQYYQVFFSVDSNVRCEEILQHLSDCEIGTKFNSVVSVIPCTLYYHGKDDKLLSGSTKMESEHNDRKFSMKMSAWEKFVHSMRARLIVAQVVEGVKANANLTFDFVILLLTSAFVAALGLAEDNTVFLVASMLISPLMGPIMAGNFGTVIGDRRLQITGVLNELFGLLGCIIAGFAFGLVAGLANEHWGNAAWPTDEMISRGLDRSLWVGLLVAIASGAALSIAILGDNVSSMVGVAISASLLPPAVNAGLLWALALIDFAWKDRVELESEDINSSVKLYTPIYSETPAIELAILGAVSLCLTLINIICIFVTGILILKIKEVAPRSSKEQEMFWKHDIKIARDYNRTVHGQDAEDVGVSRPSMRDIENLYTTLGSQQEQIRKRRHSGGTIWPTAVEHKSVQLFGGPSSASTVTTSCSTVPSMASKSNNQLSSTDKIPQIIVTEPDPEQATNDGQVRGRFLVMQTPQSNLHMHK